MNRESFYEEVVSKLKEHYGEGFEISISYIPKNNGIIKTAFNIRPENNNISPTIYAEQFFEMYSGGTSIEEIVNYVIDVYENSEANTMTVDTDELFDYECIKDKLAVKVVSKVRNLDMIDKFVTREFLDLLIIPVICIEKDASGIKTVRVDKNIASKWNNVSYDEIVDTAIANNKRIFETTCRSLSDVITNLIGLVDDEVPEVPIKVLSNREGVNGASAILDTESLDMLYADIGSFFIIPSSVHELLCIPVDNNNASDILALVKEVNNTQVMPEEILSYNIYHYDGNVVSVIFADSKEGDENV